MKNASLLPFTDFTITLRTLMPYFWMKESVFDWNKYEIRLPFTGSYTHSFILSWLPNNILHFQGRPNDEARWANREIGLNRLRFIDHWKRKLSCHPHVHSVHHNQTPILDCPVTHSKVWAKSASAAPLQKQLTKEQWWDKSRLPYIRSKTKSN